MGWSSLRRRMSQAVIALYIIALLGSLALVLGPYFNDRAIESDEGRALAQVTDVGRLRTTVDFQDEEGIFHAPETGLLYPGGLGVGQRVWVNYDRANPDLVKVAGREWTLSLIPALSVAAVSTLIAGLSWRFIAYLGRGPVQPPPGEPRD